MICERSTVLPNFQKLTERPTYHKASTFQVIHIGTPKLTILPLSTSKTQNTNGENKRFAGNALSTMSEKVHNPMQKKRLVETRRKEIQSPETSPKLLQITIAHSSLREREIDTERDVMEERTIMLRLPDNRPRSTELAKTKVGSTTGSVRFSKIHPSGISIRWPSLATTITVPLNVTFLPK